MANYNPYFGLAGTAGFAGQRAAVLASCILDSCSAKECVEDLQLLFTEADQAVIDASRFAKGIAAQVIDVTFETADFITGRNCYSVDVTFFFAVEILAYRTAGGEPVALTGYCCYSKNMLLSGGENGVRTFTSNGGRTECSPEASAQVADPVLLNVCLTEVPECEPCPLSCGREPCTPGTDLVRPAVGEKTVFCALGVFCIVSLNRTVQMVVPFIDYAVPQRDYTPASSNPCELFENVSFPVRKFFPGRGFRP